MEGMVSVEKTAARGVGMGGSFQTVSLYEYKHHVSGGAKLTVPMSLLWKPGRSDSERSSLSGDEVMGDECWG